MAELDPERFERADLRESTRRDLRQRARRSSGAEFWRALGLLGSVGWPVALLGVGGAVIGRQLDRYWDSEPGFAAAGLLLGTLLGTWIALRALRGGG